MQPWQVFLITFLLISILGTIIGMAIIYNNFGGPPKYKHYIVEVQSDGIFSPQNLTVHPGDTVEWQSVDPTVSLDPILPVFAPTKFDNYCTGFKAYDPADPNDFTGPLPQAIAGAHVISPMGTDPRGFEIDPLSGLLTQTGDPYATMDWTFEDTSITAVFIRLRWNTVHLGPGKYDWTVMDREIMKAVANGKYFSLSFKAGNRGTPDWIFDPNLTSPYPAAESFTFRENADFNSTAPGDCGFELTLGSPADPKFKKLYFDMWRAAAKHIRGKNYWFRNLAYVKPSGANFITHENKIPKSCVAGCFCNDSLWVKEAGLTPSSLARFYSEQNAVLAEEFPGKTLSYMLIQDGFPAMNDAGEWSSPGHHALVPSATQLENILAQGRGEHGMMFAVQHNGIRWKKIPGSCPRKPADGCPNWWVLKMDESGAPTGYQVVNKVKTGSQTDSTFQNVYDNSQGLFLELYERSSYNVTKSGPILDPSALIPRTIKDWDKLLHDRRAARTDLPPEFPWNHTHVFSDHGGAPGDTLNLFYVNEDSCQNLSKSNHWGLIRVAVD